jgi:hypothetical protein
MKIKNLLLLVITLQLQTFYAQDDDYSFNGSYLQSYQMVARPSEQSPDVAAFQKITQVPVSNYTGRANVTIPIFEIKAGAMTVPISISYNSSGVKVADMPSNVGSNWALSAGGVVTKAVQGIDDFTIPRYLGNRYSDFNKYASAGWNIKELGRNYNSSRQNDPAPDVYHVSAPGLSTKYIHAGEGIRKITPVEIENNGNVIEDTIGELYRETFSLGGNLSGSDFDVICYGLKNISIKSLQGIEYSFKTPEISLNNTSGEGFIQNIFFGFQYQANAYKLDRMFDPSTNKTISFKYEEYRNNFRDTFYHRVNTTSSTSNTISNRLTNIYFDGGEVQFLYDLQREDNTGEKALTEVKVLNHIGVVIKRIKFEYSYFQTIINPGTPQSKRLKLDRVYQIDAAGNSSVGKYIFTYNTNVNMPPRDSWAHDFLGYNNNSYSPSNSNPVPKLYYNDNAYWDNFFSTDDMRSIYTPFDNGTAQVEDENEYNNNNNAGNFSLEANEEASKAYILKKIQYPTGGITEFEYESNQFSYSGDRKGGGLRVKTLKLIDEYGVEQIKDYGYSLGYINSIPGFISINYKYGQEKLKVFNVPQKQIELTSGAFVGYGYVSVTNRYNKEESTYSYFTGSTYKNIASTKTVFGYQGSTWKGKGLYSLFVDRDILRGKLRSKIVFDQNEVLVLRQDYEYLLKEFETIQYSFQNESVIRPLSSNSCFEGDGTYDRNCGGYDEVIDFPIERNLLIRVKTKVLEDFHDDTTDTQGVTGTYVETEKRYHYDVQYPRIISEEQGRNLNRYSDEEELAEALAQCMGDPRCEDQVRAENLQQNPNIAEFVRKTYTYPSNTSPLWSQHRLTTPEFVTVRNENMNLKSEYHHYKNFGQGIIGIEKVDYFGPDRFRASPKESVVITKRDSKGNILEAVSQDGISTSFIYGYDSRYLICELKNVSYTELTVAATAQNISLEQLISTNSDIVIKSKTNQLREQLSNGQITSYTYLPLVGLTSIIDIRGIETTYEYDNFNRLEFIKDYNQNILSKNTYNYKN